jgi:TIR domain
MRRRRVDVERGFSGCARAMGGSSMRVTRWIVQPHGQFRNGDEICELEADGEACTIIGKAHPDDACNVYWYLVDEGNEVGPWGMLLEYSDSGFRKSGRCLHPIAHQRLVRRDRYPRIFLSYRRTDGEAYAGRLHETLTRAFGREDVFMDQFSVRPGEVFGWTIQQAVAHADVVLALIGPQWLTITDGTFRRLMDDRDFVRREIAAALDRGTPVIPIILPGATVPRMDYNNPLPEELSTLPDLQAMDLTARHYETGTEELITEIRRYLD